MDPEIFCARCADMPVRQLAPYISANDAALMSLVRGLLTTPGLLVIHSLPLLGPHRTVLVRNLLAAYVAGWHPASLSVCKKGGSAMHLLIHGTAYHRKLCEADHANGVVHARTVVWMAPRSTADQLPSSLWLDEYGVLEVV